MEDDTTMEEGRRNKKRFKYTLLEEDWGESMKEDQNKDVVEDTRRGEDEERTKQGDGCRNRV